jgi:hypothetical protein
MRFTSTLSAGLITTGVLMSAAFCLPGQAQNDQDQSSNGIQPKELQIKGMPPRVAPTEYQAHAPAGSVTIAAEFMGHSIPTPEHTFSSEDFIVVEAGLFGPPGSHATLSRDDFTLRVAGRKTPLESEPFELVMRSLKDPEWQPPESEESKDKGSKSGLTTGGGGGQNDAPPPLPPKMPFALRRAMEQQVQRSMMEAGDRPLPQAGLLFFRYGGKAENIKSLELIYSGAAGKATLELQP